MNLRRETNDNEDGCFLTRPHFYIFRVKPSLPSLSKRTFSKLRSSPALFPSEYKATVSLSFFFVFGIFGGGEKKKRKERRKGTKKETDTTVFKYNFPRWYGGRGLAQSTIRYSYVRGMHTACPNSAASFCGKIRAFRDRLNNNRIETFQLFSRGYRGPKNLYRIRVPPSSFSFLLFFVAPFL